MTFQNPFRREVLRIYRQILKAGVDWSSTDPSKTEIEQQYIREESRKLFKSNKHLREMPDIRNGIQEAKDRLELAIHYKNPFPRPICYPLKYVTKSRGKVKNRIFQQSIPSYLKSTHKDD